MKMNLANPVRIKYTETIRRFLENEGEDVGLIASNKINFPIVVDDEEGFIEVAISVVKKPSDECYQEREDYLRHCAEMEAKRAEMTKAKAEKAEKAKAKAKAKKEE